MTSTPDTANDSAQPRAIDQAVLTAIKYILSDKLLGRTAAFLSLLLLGLTKVSEVDAALTKFLVFEWQRWLLYGLLLCVVAVHLLVEWRAERNRRQVQALAVLPQAVPTGYFRIGPYTAADAPQFQRADQAHEKVLVWLSQASSVPLYLTGDSGSGKSSLLNAFVLPRLREQQWTLIEARAWQDPLAALHAAVSKLSGGRRRREEEATTLRDWLEAAARRAEVRLLLVLDQFEEFLILASAEAQAAFAAWVTDLQTHPIPKLSLLLVLRSDYQIGLEEAGLPRLRQGENWFQVGRFSLKAAQVFMERSSLGLQPAALERILDSAAVMDDSPGLIRPITLNVIGHVLAEGKQAALSLDADQLVQHYIEQSIGQPVLRRYVRPVLEQLLTEQGSKRPRSERELREATQLQPAEVRAVLNGLALAALARPLDVAHEAWELSHDFIARAISGYLGRRREPWWQQSAYYVAPALLGVMLTALGLFAGYQWTLRRPIYRDSDWVRIEAGEFCMGARANSDTPADCHDVAVDAEARPEESPLHRVILRKPFLLAKYEVTLEEYERFARDQGRSPPGDAGLGAGLDDAQQKRLPVINVSWQDAAEYAAWLSAKTGKRLRLPSEAEWEYAVRAGSRTPRFWDALPGDACRYANVLDRQHRPPLSGQDSLSQDSAACDDPYVTMAPVGSFAPNAWGLHDMVGNVAEWLADTWHQDYRGAPLDGSAWDKGGDAEAYVMRGGSWDVPGGLRSAHRQWGFSDTREKYLGFRLAQDI